MRLVRWTPYSTLILLAAVIARKTIDQPGGFTMAVLSRNYLRRKDARRRVMFGATVECRGVVQTVRVVDFSASGLRIDCIKGLATGDPVRIIFTPELSVDGEIAWAVWHKAGVKFRESLPGSHPTFLFLLEQATATERAKTLALAALAKERARR